MKNRRPLLSVGAIFLALLAGIMLVGLVHRQIAVPLGPGVTLRVHPASFWSSLLESSCSLTYKINGTDAGTLSLLETRIEWLIMAIPAVDTNCFLCLYDFDGDLRLFTVHTKNVFKPKPSGTPLAYIVLVSPWEVTDAGSDDWQTALKYVQQLPLPAYKQRAVPNLDVCIMKFYVDKQALTRRMAQRIGVLFQTNR